ncbi:MAG: class I SAM-dependent methyltransferase [Bacteroidales bacterium]|nr:class I SAM-dependent methyltransferase [Bacteroidales bacterium]
MQKEEFYTHLCEELRQNQALYPYYKLTYGSPQQQQFRKAYFMQRLSYLEKYLDTTKPLQIWDCGCGYGTTGLFLAMNGIPSTGSSLEYYIDQLENRRQFWQQYGDTSLFTYRYANVFDQTIEPESFDVIIMQDTLHHIEPIQEALPLFYSALKKGGRLILIEENGGCWLKSMMLFLKRGNKKVVEMYDEVLKKKVLMGNENIRSEKQWRQLFEKTPFKLIEDSVSYIRILPPSYYKKRSCDEVVQREQTVWYPKKWFREHFFFGLNMVFEK